MRTVHRRGKNVSLLRRAALRRSASNHREAIWNTLCPDTRGIVLRCLFSSDCVRQDLNLLRLRVVNTHFRHHARHIQHRSKIFRRASDLTSAALEPSDFVRGIVAVLIDLAAVRAPKFPVAVYSKLYHYIAAEVCFEWLSSKPCRKSIHLRKSLYLAAIGYEESTSTAAVLIHEAALCREGERRVIQTLGKLFRLLNHPYPPPRTDIITLLDIHLRLLRRSSCQELSNVDDLPGCSQ